jgi:dCMP deaminase
MADWDKRFMDLANHIASWSKDRSRKVGSVIVNNDKRVISEGYNGFAANINDDVEERHQKPMKYFYVVHAEANAIYMAAKSGISTKGCVMYVNFHPCSECAKAIIQSGIKKVVTFQPIITDSKWKETAEISKNMLKEAGVDVVYLEENEN